MSGDFSHISALVLAGERPGRDPWLVAEGVDSKADIPVAGQSMLDHVLAALGCSGLARPIRIAGAKPAARARLATGHGVGSLEHLPACAGPAASALAGLEAVGRYPLLVTTSDHPLLTPSIITAFVTAALDSNADLAVGLATKETIEAEYPDVRRTYFPVGGRRVSGCNLFLVTSSLAKGAIAFWAQAEADRKHPLRLARRFGLLNALALLRPGVSLDQVFGIVSRRLGCTIRPVLLAEAAAAIDVDKPGDLSLVRAIMAEPSEAQVTKANDHRAQHG